MCDWVCTTWEETGPDLPDNGLSWAVLPCRGDPFSGHFWGHFWGPFLTPFWSTFGLQNGPQNGPKTAPKLDFFEVYFWIPFLEGFGALSGPSGCLLGSLEALLGGLWVPKTKKKIQGFLRFLKMSLFGSLKLLMALLGTSCALLGPIRCQNGPQNGAQKWSKRGPKRAPKNDLKNDPKSADFGSQNGPKIGFLGALKTWAAGPFLSKMSVSQRTFGRF